MLCILLLTGSGTAFSVSYPKMFGDDWTSAVQFIDAHHVAWKTLFEEFGVDARLAEAIVFPELIRYSRWQDEIETAAVNGLYVLQGTSGANFSIGRFQMKPSFAEEVEAAWNQSPLAKEYGFVFNLQDGVRHPQLLSLPSQEQVALLATIYNRSFSTTWEQACQLRRQKSFHTDMIVTRHTKRYSFADIAQAFFCHPERSRGISN